MIKYFRVIFCISGLLTAATGLLAQPVASAGMSADARSAGLAGVSVAMDAHAMSLYTNMAAAGFADPAYRIQAGYGFSDLRNDNYLHALGAYYRLNEKHTFGFGVRVFHPDKVYNTQDGIAYTTAQPYDMLIDLAYARRVNPYLALSVNARYVRSKLNEGSGFETASTVALDLGLQYRRNDYTLAASVSNLGMLVDYGVAEYRMPAAVKAGGAYRWDVAPEHRLTGLAEARYNFMPSEYQFISGGVGAEYSYRGMVALRGGYYLASETKAAGNYGALGAGVYLGAVMVDFAYNLAGYDSPMHKIWRISAGVRF